MRPMIAVIVPGCRSEASFMRRPLVATREKASSRLREPAATRAVNSPRLWPAKKAGWRCRAPFSRAAARQASEAAEKKVKTGTVVLVVVLAIVAIYMGVIYYRLKPQVQPEYLVHLGAQLLPNYEEDVIKVFKDAAPAMVARLDPQFERMKTRLPEMRKEYAEKIKAQIPRLIERLGPRMEEIRDALPEARAALAERLKEGAPGLADNIRPRLAEFRENLPDLTETWGGIIVDQSSGIAKMLKDRVVGILPRLRKAILRRVQSRLDQEDMSQIGDVVNKAVSAVLTEHKKNVAVLTHDDLAKALEEAFEKAAGYVLDDFAGPLGASITQVNADMKDLLARAPDNLTEEEALELRLVQLVNTYFKVRMLEPEE